MRCYCRAIACHCRFRACLKSQHVNLLPSDYPVRPSVWLTNDRAPARIARMVLWLSRGVMKLFVFCFLCWSRVRCCCSCVRNRARVACTCAADATDRVLQWLRRSLNVYGGEDSMRIQSVMRRYAALRTMLCEHGIRPHAAFDPAATRNASELKTCDALSPSYSTGCPTSGKSVTWLEWQASMSFRPRGN